MAEVTGLRNNALNFPVYGLPWGVVFPILDADGDLVTGAASLDSEVSLNGDTFADCTNEATEIATSSGMYYLLLTSAEMSSNVVTVIVKTATAGAKTTPMVFYPRTAFTVLVGTAAGGTSSTIVLDAGGSAVDGAYVGCLCVGILDGTTEVRPVLGYTGSTKTVIIYPNWVTTPDSDDTFALYFVEGMQISQADVRTWIGAAVATPTVAGVPEVDVTHWIGTAAATPTVAGVPEVDVTHLNGVAQSLQDLKDFADDGYDPATNKVQGVVLVDTVTTVTGGATAAAVAAVQADTDNIQTRLPAALTAGGNMKTDDLYALGRVWMDTGSGAAGTTSYVNGTLTNPSSSMANARTIANALNLTAFQIRNGSSITLDQGYSGFNFYGDKWTLALASRSITNSHFQGADVSGLSTGTGAEFHDCIFAAVTVADGSKFDRCGLAGTFTLQSAGNYIFTDCFTATVAGVDAVIDFGALGATTVGMRGYAGGLEVRNMAAGDVLTFIGDGRLTIAASCTAGTVLVAGNVNLVNNGSGQTVSDTARFNEDQNIGINWANITNAATAQNLSATNIDVDQVVASVSGNVGGTINGLTATALADFFDTNSGTTYGAAVAGSVVKEIASNASGSTPATIATAVWTEALPGLYAGGTAGFLLGTNLDALISSRMATYTQPTGFLAATFPAGTVASTTNITAGTMTTTTSVTNDVGITQAGADKAWATAVRVLTAGTNIVLAKGVGVTGFNDLSAAQVNAEVVDALAVDTYAEPTGVPGATVALAEKIGRIYQALRNGLDVDSNTGFKHFKDDALAVIWKKSVADAGGIYQEGEAVAP